MSEKISQKFKSLFEKIPKEKRSLAILPLAVILIFCIIFTDTSANKKSEFNEKEKCMTDTDYVSQTEEKLSEIIKSIEGAGETKVMVTLDCSEENIYANNINNDKTEYVIIKVNSQEGGLLLRIVQPKIRGVAIVCQGGDLYSVKNDIINTVCSVLDISSAKVSIAKME